MKITNLLLIACLLASAVANSQTVPDWENPAITKVNVERAHASLISYESEKAAIENQRNTKRVQSLNGSWKFNFSTKPADRHLTFFDEQTDVSNWKSIPVPSNWQLHGYGYANYTNIIYPFPKNAPHIPHDHNPVGQYRREFNVPSSWMNHQVFIHFGAVNSAFYVWVNGQKVGYNQDSKLPAEFNITPYIRKGKNIVAVEVYQFCDGSYLEDQDFWRLAGIEREVYLHARPQVMVRDFFARATLDDTYSNGLLNLDVELKNYTKKADAQVKVVLYKDKVPVYTEVKKATVNASSLLNFQTTLPDVAKWSAEKPNLYTLTVQLLDEKGKVSEVISQRIGFRSVEIKGGQLLVNGQPVLIKGVNRHEHDPVTGHVVDKASMLKDIDLLKKFNINAVRTSHYPNDPLWYELCDEYGIYLYDEANVEIHDYGWTYNELAVHPDWHQAIVERILNVVERDKNHPSVIVYSMGNESGTGPSFIEAYQKAKERDITRLVHYERAEDDEEYKTMRHTDIIGWMYASFDLADYLTGRLERDRPFIWCEYAHSMGNSTGNLVDFWDYIRIRPQAQGGFIWDMVDQGLTKTTADGQSYFGYGGDFEPDGVHNDSNFCANGLVFADRTIQPAMWEVKKVYQSVHFKAIDQTNLAYSVFNEFDFTNLSEYAINYTIFEDGRSIVSGTLPSMDVKPYQTKEFVVSCDPLKTQPGKEYFINFEVVRLTDAPFTPKGHVIASEQFKLPNAKTGESPSLLTEGKIAHNDNGNAIVISTGNGIELVVDKATAALTSYKVQGEEYLLKPLTVNYWRAPVDNDKGSWMHIKSAMFNNVADQLHVLDVKVKTLSNGQVEVTTVSELKGLALIHVSYLVGANGAVEVTHRFEPLSKELPYLPRMGMNMHIQRQFDNLRYYGRGPHENYCDKKMSADVGLYSAKVADLYVPYIRPQEHGYRTDVRWLSLTDANGKGVKILGAPTIGFNARHHYDSDLETTFSRHSTDIKDRNIVNINIDYKQTGVGGDTTWGALPHQKYTVFPEDMQYRFVLMPVQ